MICFFSSRKFTGGPLAIHQAVLRATALGGDAVVMFIKKNEKKKEKYFEKKNGKVKSLLNFRKRYRVDKRLKVLKAPTVTEIDTNAHFIVPEGMPDLATQLLRSGCKNVYIWWLSVDNFPLDRLKTLETLALMKDCRHLCQSVYAKNFVLENGASETMMLSDVTDVGEIAHTPDLKDRKFDIAYLPAKAAGAENAVKKLSEKFNVVALQNMSRLDIQQTLLNTKIFLDFGHHPGKDRVPREAALCGAVPVVRKAGAATVWEDVPLPDELLIDTEVFLEEDRLQDRLSEIMSALDHSKFDLEDYKARIRKEGAQFDAELMSLITQTKKA